MKKKEEERERAKKEEKERAEKEEDRERAEKEELAAILGIVAVE